MFGRLAGFPGAIIPPGSRLVGAKSLRLGGGFFASGPVRIEAVHRHGEDVFQPYIEIGENFQAGDRLHIAAIDHVSIGRDCLFGSGILVTDHSHGRYTGSGGCSAVSRPADRRLWSRGEVVIGDRVWLGDGVVVLPGVTIGQGTVVGANSVVTRDIPMNVVVAGNPAIILRDYDGAAGWIDRRRGP